MFEKGHLLSMHDLSEGDIFKIISAAKQMKKIVTGTHKKTDHLAGKSIQTLFYENSTRTRVSFELAAKYMGAATASLSAPSSSVAKGESLIDTGKTLERMGTDIIVLRHPMSGAPHLLARNVSCGVINAGDGVNEHPTQALLDIFTIAEKKKNIKDLKIAIIGDIAHSRVARGNIIGLSKMGAQVYVAGPGSLIPIAIEQMGAKLAKSADEAIEGADVVMALRLQLERQKKGLFPTGREYHSLYGVTMERIGRAKKDMIIMHPAPINRGLEISSDVADFKLSLIGEQVTNGVAVRMALLYFLTKRGLSDEIIN